MARNRLTVVPKPMEVAVRRVIAVTMLMKRDYPKRRKPSWQK